MLRRGWLLVMLVLASMVMAQESSLTANDLARLGEITRVLNTQAPSVWQGWQAPPQLVCDAAGDYLIGHPHPPTGFSPLPGVSIAGARVFHRDGHVVPIPAATAWPLEGTWVLAIPTLGEFQQAIDQQLGAGTVRLNDAAYVAAAVHEAFHAHQITVATQWPTFGFQGNEQVTQLGLSVAKVNLAAEGRALRAALEAPSKAAARQQATLFWALREDRRRNLSANTIAFERSLEWREGLARYAEISLMRRLAGQRSGDARFTYPADAWATFLNWLADVRRVPGSVREQYALLGAAQGFLLDRLHTDWHDHALLHPTSLESMLLEVVPVISSLPRPAISP